MDQWLSEHERRQIEEIRQLDMEELQVEVDNSQSSSSSDDDLVRNGHDETSGFTFNTSLASMHTYLGEIDDAHGTLSILEGGKILKLPMFYLQGVVLFPGATLPLKIVEYQDLASFLKAVNQTGDSRLTVGVIHVTGNLYDSNRKIAAVGTTAEIKQYRRLEDGSINVVTRGQQRFRLIRRFIDDDDGAPCAKVQIIEEETPQRTPRDAFAKLASVSNPNPNSNISPIKKMKFNQEDQERDSPNTSTSSSKQKRKKCLFGSPSSNSNYENDEDDESASEEGELGLGFGEGSESVDNVSERLRKCYGVRRNGLSAPLTFWPKWVYDMFDSYTLSRRAAGLWREIIKQPSLDEFVRKPDILSFYIASKLPLSESTRQELLEIDGVSYRLRRQIQLLKALNHLRCKNCLTLIAKRSDMVPMSTEGPLSAFVNSHGFVHEVITVYNANGLELQGGPVKEHSWFPGYAWTITNCASCDSNMGWLFTAVKRDLLPRSFWGIRSSQVADDTRSQQN